MTVPIHTSRNPNTSFRDTCHLGQLQSGASHTCSSSQYSVMPHTSFADVYQVCMNWDITVGKEGLMHSELTSSSRQSSIQSRLDVFCDYLT
jgi:hypothetical protein